MDSLRTLAFIDSGIGGLPYLRRVAPEVPGFRLAYVADTAGFPYGTKDPDQVVATVLSMTGRLMDRYRPEAVVVACNTASVLALDVLRKTFPVPFVGVVPAVKPAAARTSTGTIAVMATERTVKGRYLDDLVAAHAPGCRVVRLAATRLVEMIERDPFQEDRSAFLSELETIKKYFVDQGADTVVLGCTHFLHLEDSVRECLGPSFSVLDSRDGVCRRTLQVLGLEARPAGAEAGPGAGGVFHLTASALPGTEDRYRRLADSFGLAWGGCL